MNYYYFNVICFDVRHHYEDRAGIRIEAESLEEAIVRAQKVSRKCEAKYPYKVVLEINLEQTIPAAVIEAEEDHSVSGLLEEV